MKKLLSTFLLLLVFVSSAAAQQTFQSGLTSNGATTTKSGITDTGKVILTQLADPSAPTPIVNGTPGATTYTYFIVGHDSAATCGGSEGVSNPSPAGSVTNGNATLNGTNFISITLPSSPLGYAFYDVLKSNTSTSLATCVGKGSTVNDTGQSTSAYTAPTRNSTGDIAASGLSIPTGSLTVGNLTASGNISITGTQSNGGDQINSVSVNKVINVQTYKASGSDNSYTCSISSVTNTTTLTCTASTDFKVGQGIMVVGAGIATPITSATAGSVTNLGASGATNDCYEVVASDPLGGMAAASAPECNATGPALGAYSPASGLQVGFTGNGNANTEYLIYRSIGGAAYTFANAYRASNYGDYGIDLQGYSDIPSTPTVRSQGLFAKVTVVGTTTNPNDTLTLDTAASTTVSGAKTRHDDTAAAQAAINAGSGSQVYFPAGTYHINQYAFWNGASFNGYTFSGGMNLANNMAGSIYIQNDNTDVAGASNTTSTLKHDWPANDTGRGALFTIHPTAFNPFNGPETTTPTLAFTSWAINNATRGSTVITATTASQAANAPIGHVIYVTGGAGVDSTYTISNISRVLLSDSTSGNIVLADGISSDLPYGTVGLASAFQDLTANNAVVSNTSIHDLAFATPGRVVNLDSAYGVNIYRTRYTQQPCFGAGYFYGQWAANLTVSDSTMVGDDGEITVDSIINLKNNLITTTYPYSNFSIKGGSAPANVIGNTSVVGCGDRALDLTEPTPQVLVSGNVFSSSCPVVPTSLNGTVGLRPSAGFPAGASNWTIVGNTIQTSGQAGILRTNAVGANQDNISIFNNNIFASGATTTGLDLTGPTKAIGNKIYLSTTGSTTAGQGVLLRAGLTTGNGQFDVENNTLVFAGAGTGVVGIEVANPAGSDTDFKRVIGNDLQGVFPTGIKVDSITKTPNVILANNLVPSASTAYNPASLVYAGLHGVGTPTVLLNGCGTIAAGSVTSGFDNGGTETTGTTTTSCAIQFATTFALAPTCSCQDQTTPANLTRCSATTTVLTITTSSNTGDVLQWFCPGT